MKKRLLKALVGMVVLAIGLNLMLLGNLGVGAFDTVTAIISEVLNINFGNAALVLHAFFLVICIGYVILKKVNPFELIVSVAAIFILTRIINLFAFIKLSGIDAPLVVYIVGFILYCVGGALMMKSNTVIAPVDKFVVVTSKLKKTNPGYVRLGTDISLLIVSIFCIYGFGVNVELSLGTLFVTFLTGFIIKFIYPYV